MRTPHCLRKSLGAAILSVAFAVLVQAGSYTFTEIGTFGGNTSYALDINEKGELAAQAYLTGYAGWAPAIYSGGVLTNISSPIAPGGDAWGINDHGAVVGTNFTKLQGYIYSNGSTQFIEGSREALSINNAGQVTGTTTHGTVYLFDGTTFTDLGAFGGNWSTGRFINQAGELVGQYETASGESHAFLYKEGTMTDLGKYQALGLNDLGEVLLRSGELNRSFLLSNGTLIDLGDWVVQTLNNRGDIVGYKDGGVVVYSGGQFVSLNAVLDPSQNFVLQVAIGINDAGQVTGWGRYDESLWDPNQEGPPQHAFLFTPVPDGGSAATFIAVSLAALLFLKRWLRVRSTC